MRHHWFDLGIVFAAVIAIGLVKVRVATIPLLLWLNLLFLLIHQFEEYRYPGYFPVMVNRVMFNSLKPDRYPLNTNTALIVNVIVGWLCYFLAAVLSSRALWLGIATILVSAGNFVAHTFVFNIKGRTKYNPGMLSALFLFGPITALFFYFTVRDKLATPADWIIGIVLGLALNYAGILKLIDLLKNENSNFAFEKRNMVPTGQTIASKKDR